MTLLLALLLCGVDATVNEKVVEFARSRLGQRVGDGQCTALAVEALRHAGAGRPRPRSGAWGDELKSLRDARPGDILQFENAVFVRRRIRDDGAFVTRTLSFPHHTAIIARVRKRGPRPVLVILHQNVGVEGREGRAVQQWTIDLAEKRGGTVTAYRPVADRPAGTGEPGGSDPFAGHGRTGRPITSPPPRLTRLDRPAGGPPRPGRR